MQIDPGYTAICPNCITRYNHVSDKNKGWIDLVLCRGCSKDRPQDPNLAREVAKSDPRYHAKDAKGDEYMALMRRLSKRNIDALLYIAEHGKHQPDMMKNERFWLSARGLIEEKNARLVITQLAAKILRAEGKLDRSDLIALH